MAFTDTERLIGEAAKNQATTNPTRTVYDAKRLIGRRCVQHSAGSACRASCRSVVRDTRSVDLRGRALPCGRLRRQTVPLHSGSRVAAVLCALARTHN